jgi:hypothetical protein
MWPPYEVLVYIYTRPNLRDETFMYESFIGRGVLESMYDKLEIREDVKELFLSFPEQWLNMLEQRQIYQRMQHYLPNLKKVTIKTHCLFIIQATPAGKAKMVSTNGTDIDSELIPDSTEVDKRLYVETVVNLNNFQKKGI